VPQPYTFLERILVMAVNGISHIAYGIHRVIRLIKIWFIAAVVAFIDGKEDGDE